MLQIIGSDNPFDAEFINFWGPGDIPYWYGYFKILKCLDCMKGFGIGSAPGMK